MPDTILPTTEISVTAVCVDRITQSVSASPLLVDSGHYVFVTVQVTAGPASVDLPNGTLSLRFPLSAVPGPDSFERKRLCLPRYL